MDITKISGEEIAKLVAAEYQKLIVTQSNIQALNAELEKREKNAKEAKSGSKKTA